jgi:DNA invertase Pin-like site-specific DNA recombinase
MFIRAYLRASKTGLNAKRAEDELKKFATERSGAPPA